MQLPSLTQSLLRRALNVLVTGISVFGCAAAGLDFEVPFFIQSSGIVTNRSFNTTNGPADGQRLLTGVRLVPSGEGVYIGIDRSTVWEVSPAGESVVESATHPELADWSMGVTYDSQLQRVVLVTLGGEGFLYQRRGSSGVWSEIASMQNEDLESLVYRPEDNCFYGIRVYNGAPSAPAALLKYSSEGEKLDEIPLPPFPVNLSPGNHTAKLEAVEGKIVALVERDPQMTLQQGDRSRIYVIDPTTGSMELSFDHPSVTPQIGFTITPKFGSQISQGIPIHITATVNNGTASAITFYDVDQKIGDGFKSTNVPPNFSFIWTNPSLGLRQLKAVGTTELGETITSRTISFTVVRTTNAPMIRFVSPATNATIFVGDRVQAVVEASDADNNMQSLEFSARGTNQTLMFDPPPIGTNRYTFGWVADRAGTARLSAIARDGSGWKNDASILLTVLDANQFVRRYLPTSYTRGVGFSVRLTAKPGTNIHAWAVEEHPPQGWQVQAPSFDGVYDPSNNVIKWGPFTDSQVRDLMYQVMPPTNATGAKDFSGIVSANGTSTQIVGDYRISDVLPFHPADVSRDNRITVDELTAYAAAWKTASTWSNGPVPIPVDYVTRAGLIWRNQEVYSFNPALPAPTCWFPPQQSSLTAALVTASEATRVFAPSLTADHAIAVTINVHPAADVESYAIEERTREGWTIVDAEGEIGSDGVLRFGPFFDAQARTFTYHVIPTTSATLGSFDGVASFDGASLTIGGASVLNVSACVAENRGGHVYLHFNVSLGQQYVLESSDAIGGADWKVETTVTGNESAIDLPAIEPTKAQRFYRLRPLAP